MIRLRSRLQQPYAKQWKSKRRFNSGTEWNRFQNKKMSLAYKGMRTKRKWKNPKAGLRRKRYYSRSFK